MEQRAQSRCLLLSLAQTRTSTSPVLLGDTDYIVIPTGLVSDTTLYGCPEHRNCVWFLESVLCK